MWAVAWTLRRGCCPHPQPQKGEGGGGGEGPTGPGPDLGAHPSTPTRDSCDLTDTETSLPSL